MCSTVLRYTFVLVCALLSPNDFATAFCAHFLPCLPNPRTSPDCGRRAGPTDGYQPGHSVLITLSTLFRSDKAQCPGQMLPVMQSVAVYCPVRCAAQKLEHAGAVSGTSVLLSAIIALIYVIPMMLVRMQAFIVTKLSLETRINALWLHNGRRSLAQRSIPINTTLCALHSPIHMGTFGINVLKRSRIAFRTK